MGIPLKNIVKNCRELEKSDQLKEFESTNGQDFRAMIKNARIASNLMVFQLKDMQDWNLLKTNNFRTISSKFSLQDSLSEVYEMMNMKASIKDLKLEISTIGQSIPAEVIGDKQRLQQILINLVQNAITYTSVGTVSVSVAYDYFNQKIDFQIKDTGIGIKPEEQDQVFKMFKDKDQDSIGLGLAICKEISQKYDGNITFDSEFRVGSNFYFSFSLEEFQKGGG